MYFDDDDDEHDPLYGLLPDLAPPSPEDEAAFRANQAAEVPRPPPPVVEPPPEPVAEPEPVAQPPAAAPAEPPLPPSLIDKEAGGAYANAPPDPDPSDKGGDSLLDDEGAQWAALFDTFLNGGRGVGKILGAAAVQKSKKKSEALDSEYKQAQIQHLRNGTTNPELLEIQRQRLYLQGQGQQLARDKEGRLIQTTDYKRSENERKKDPSSAEMNAIRDNLSQHLTPEQLERTKGLSLESMAMLKTVLEKQVETSQPIVQARARAAGEKATATTAGHKIAEHDFAEQTAKDEALKTREKNRADLETAAALAEARARGGQAGRGDLQERKFRYTQAEDFKKNYKEDLDVQGLITDIDRDGVNAKTSQMLENAAIGSPLVEKGIVDPKRLDVVAARRLLLEIWGRALTGKAGTGAEDKRFALEAGTAAFQGAEQVNAAYEALKRVIQRRIRIGANGNPGAYDAVGYVVEDPDYYLGLNPGDAANWSRRPAPSPESMPQPQQPAAPQAGPPRQTAAGQPPPTPPPAALDEATEDLKGLQLPIQERPIPGQPGDLGSSSFSPGETDEQRAATQRGLDLYRGSRRGPGAKKHPAKKTAEQQAAEDLLKELGL